MYQLDALT